MKQKSRPSSVVFAEWRDRQIARCELIFSKIYNDNTPHIPFAIELSQGCSVGCWFCGVSAGKLASHFEASADNVLLFSSILQILTDYCGTESAQQGILYWATDPLDNPSYESFCNVFLDITGSYPSTTTAISTKNRARTLSLINSSIQNGAPTLRFSISTLRQLKTLYEYFSAEELGSVEVMPMCSGSLLKPSNTGRVLERNKVSPLAENRVSQESSIACVSGFLINLVDRTVKLITPCNSSDENPLGYIVHEQVIFSSSADFRETLTTMMSHNMVSFVKRDVKLKFLKGFSYLQKNEGFSLRGYDRDIEVSGNIFLSDVGEAISKGNIEPEEFISSIQSKFGLDRDIPLGWLQNMADRGLLDDSPEYPKI